MNGGLDWPCRSVSSGFLEIVLNDCIQISAVPLGIGQIPAKQQGLAEQRITWRRSPSEGFWGRDLVAACGRREEIAITVCYSYSTKADIVAYLPSLAGC